MNHIRRFAAACAVALGACLPSAHATALDADGQWRDFYVDTLTATDGGLGWIDTDTGAAVAFELDVPTGHVAWLTVVDGGFAGDRFTLQANGQRLGTTGAAEASYPDTMGLDFDAALADTRYSRGSFTLAAGRYTITGLLSTSATIAGVPLDATVGGLRAVLAPVPEPDGALLLLAGLPLVAWTLRRRVRAH